MKLRHWVKDYLYMLYGHGHVFAVRRPPKHYLEPIKENKTPIVLLPGILTKWNFLNWIAEPLSLAGHPVYIVESLGWHTKEIDHSAELVRKLIDDKQLNNVVLLAHSKGGLVGKYVLAFHNADNKVNKLIAIATPFAGSRFAGYIPFNIFRELAPGSAKVKLLQERFEPNQRIVSIFGIYDNHVWPEASCKLAGAKNIQVPIYGHHKILFDDKVKDIVLSEVK
ncbi:MAG TPA: alpha/beta fold hydrolase [Patescibacteria group bacterium]|jgi:pimeloyl-ACP methyl ester carboxylesterase|nr:alpha/beta fold hydrolase [Patescibacteria group bacterium]